jgi:hypothetical protein
MRRFKAEILTTCRSPATSATIAERFNKSDRISVKTVGIWIRIERSYAKIAETTRAMLNEPTIEPIFDRIVATSSGTGTTCARNAEI